MGCRSIGRPPGCYPGSCRFEPCRPSPHRSSAAGQPRRNAASWPTMTRSHRPFVRGLSTAAALLLVITSTAGAQSLRVQVTEEQSGSPLAGAVAEVLDAADGVVAQGVLS